MAIIECTIELAIFNSERGLFAPAVGLLQELMVHKDVSHKNGAAVKAIYDRAGIMKEMERTREASAGF